MSIQKSPQEQRELTDIYEFSDWLKKHYIGAARKPLKVTPAVGGLIYVEPTEDTTA